MEIQSVTSRPFHNALSAYRCLPHVTAKLCGDINTAALRRAALVRLSTFLYDEGELQDHHEVVLPHNNNYNTTTTISAEEVEGEEVKKKSRSRISNSALNDPPVMLTSEVLSWILASCGIEPITATTTNTASEEEEGQQLSVALKPLLFNATSQNRSASSHSSFKTVLESQHQHIDPVAFLASLYATPGDGHNYRCDFGERSVLDGVVKVIVVDDSSENNNIQQFFVSHVEHVCIHLVAAVCGRHPATAAFEPIALQIHSLFSKVQPHCYQDVGASSLPSLRIPLFPLALSDVASPPPFNAGGSQQQQQQQSSGLKEEERNSPLVTLMSGFSAAEVNIRSIRIFRDLIAGSTRRNRKICPPLSSSASTQLSNGDDVSGVFEAAVQHIQSALDLEHENEDSTTIITTLRVAVALALKGLDSLPCNSKEEEECPVYLGTLLVMDGDNAERGGRGNDQYNEKEMKSLVASLRLLRPFPSLYTVSVDPSTNPKSPTNDVCFKVSNVESYEDLTNFEKNRNEASSSATTVTLGDNTDCGGGSGGVVSVSFSIEGYSDISYTIYIPSHTVLTTFGKNIYSGTQQTAAIRASEGDVARSMEIIRGIRLAAIGGSSATLNWDNSIATKLGVTTTTSLSSEGLATQFITALGTSSYSGSKKPMATTVVNSEAADRYKLLRRNRLTTGEKRPRDDDDDDENNTNNDDVVLRCLGDSVGGRLQKGRKEDDIFSNAKVLDPLVGLLINRLVPKRLPSSSASTLSPSTQEHQEAVSHRTADSLVAKGVNSLTNLLHNGLPKPPPAVPQHQPASHIAKVSTGPAGILAPPQSTTTTSTSPFYSSTQPNSNVVIGSSSTTLKPAAAVSTPSLSVRVGATPSLKKNPTTSSSAARVIAPVPNSGNKSVFASPPPAVAAAPPPTQQQTNNNNNTKRGGRGGRDAPVAGGGRGGRGGGQSSTNNNNAAPQQQSKRGGRGSGGGRGGRRGRG